MPTIPSAPVPLPALLAHAAPAVLIATATLAGAASRAPASTWRLARHGTTWALALASASLVHALASGAATPGLAGALVACLIAFLGWVVSRYSANYLEGQARQPFYGRWLLATLGCASLVVATDHLGVLAAAWFGASLSLQNLLTFYGDRPAALMAAHKKFLLSRLADACLLGALVLFGTRFGTLQIEELVTRATASTPDGSTQTATLLLVMAVLLKSAQLPFHGWLIQVMEAPTPVSALLHAGVVNLGGYVLIRTAGLVTAVPAASVLLVAVGGATAAIAALVTSTRISIKVALAWSTCAQMGFMLMQCGLGLPEMALLHLLAHSLYKAHAFLSSGGMVQRAIVQSMAATPEAAPRAMSIAAVGGMVMVAVAAWLWQVGFETRPGVWATAAIVGLALAPLLAGGASGARIGVQTVTACAVATAYFGLHQALHLALPIHVAAPPDGLWILPLVLFALVFVVQLTVSKWPHTTSARRIYAWFYGGLFLDEGFTRLSLRLWPLARTAQPSSIPARVRIPGELR